MATKTIHAFTAITNIDAADEILAWDDSASTTRKITWANALTNATLVTPTIASFANAQHTHANAAGGGTLTGYLATTGATTGATSQAQTFTNGINGGTAANDDLTINGTSHVTKASSYVILQPSGGFVGIGTSTPATPLQIVGTLGEIRASTSLTDATQKGARFTIAHYTNAEEPLVGFIATSDVVENTVFYGGGSGAGNAATQLIFYAAANNITTTGTAIMYIRSTGVFFGGTTPATAWADFAAATTARASTRTRVGVRPTTPNAGDSWDDGATVHYQVNATTASITNSLKLERGSSGTPAAGFGLGIVAQLESSTTETQDAGRLTWEWGTATHASRAAKGKLTAYYTSTEREAITWTADSAGATVYVNPAGGGVSVGDTTSPGVSILRLGGTIGGAGGAGLYIDPTTNAAAGTQYGLRILGNPANATDFIGLGIHGSVNLTNYRNSIWVGNESGRPGINIGYDYNVAAPEKGLIMAGKLGVGVSSPQSILHGHDGSGGFLFVNRASVGGTLVTVIPNGTGDVTEKIFFVGWCTNSSPFSADVAPTTLTVSSSTTKTDGVNTLTIAVAADGSFTLQATAGAATWNVNLWVFWR